MSKTVAVTKLALGLTAAATLVFGGYNGVKTLYAGLNAQCNHPAIETETVRAERVRESNMNFGIGALEVFGTALIAGGGILLIKRIGGDPAPTNG